MNRTDKPRRPEDLICIALDFEPIDLKQRTPVDVLDEARRLIDQLKGEPRWLKVGSQLHAAGARACVDPVQLVHQAGARCFLDTKLDNTPEVVGYTVVEHMGQGVEMTNLHVGGGGPMMKAARTWAGHASEILGQPQPLLIAVTVLTTLTPALAQEACIFVRARHLQEEDEAFEKDALKSTVVRRAKLAQASGMDGVVASAEELTNIREACGDDFFIVTPGIRMAGDDPNEQKRVDSPTAAVERGSNMIVVGRPVTKPSKGTPLDAYRRLLDEVGKAMA